MNKDQLIRIELTEEQRKQVKEAGGKEIKAIELTMQELEERIAPFGNVKI